MLRGYVLIILYSFFLLVYSRQICRNSIFICHAKYVSTRNTPIARAICLILAIDPYASADLQVIARHRHPYVSRLDSGNDPIEVHTPEGPRALQKYGLGCPLRVLIIHVNEDQHLIHSAVANSFTWIRTLWNKLYIEYQLKLSGVALQGHCGCTPGGYSAFSRSRGVYLSPRCQKYYF